MGKTTVGPKQLLVNPAVFETPRTFAALGRGELRNGQAMAKTSTGISLPILLTVMVLYVTLAAAQGNRSAATAPVLHYDLPKNFMRSAIYPPEDYVATEFRGSFQVYPFEPFSGNPVEAFQRTLFRDRSIHVIGKKTSQGGRNSDATRSRARRLLFMQASVKIAWVF